MRTLLQKILTPNGGITHIPGDETMPNPFSFETKHARTPSSLRSSAPSLLAAAAAPRSTLAAPALLDETRGPGNERPFPSRPFPTSPPRSAGRVGVGGLPSDHDKDARRTTPGQSPAIQASPLLQMSPHAEKQKSNSGDHTPRSKEALPEGWEMKLDIPSGKVFYVNHSIRAISWERPRPNAVPDLSELSARTVQTSSATAEVKTSKPQPTSHSMGAQVGPCSTGGAKNSYGLSESMDSTPRGYSASFQRSFESNGEPFLAPSSNGGTAISDWSIPRSHGSRAIGDSERSSNIAIGRSAPSVDIDENTASQRPSTHSRPSVCMHAVSGVAMFYMCSS